MANAYGAPNVTNPGDWPAPVTTRDVIEWTPIYLMQNLANLCLAHVGAGVLVQQSWQGGLEWGAAPIVDGAPIAMLVYAIPVVSSGHLTLRVQVRGERVELGGGGDPLSVVEVYSPTADASLSFTLDELEWQTDELTIEFGEDRAAERVERIKVFLYGTADEWAARLHQIVIEAVRIEQPLPAARIDGAAPIGTIMVIADAPLSTPTAHLLIDAIEAAYDRPVMGMAWSAVDPAYVAEDAALAPFGVMPPSIGIESALPIPGEWGVASHAYVPDDADVQAVEPLRTRLPAKADAGWYSQHDARAIGASMPGSPACLPIGIGVEVGATTAPLSLSVWARPVMPHDAIAWEEEV